MEKKEIADVLDEIGVLLELKGENPFRTRAYRNAAQALRGSIEDVHSLVENKTLTSIKGIGSGIAEVITELVLQGKTAIHQELKEYFPVGVREMLRVQGLGPKKIKILFEEVHITSIQELKAACAEHKLKDLDGFGIKTEENILKGISLLERSSDKHLFPEAKSSADKIVRMLSDIKGVSQCEYAGSLRRKKEIIGDIDVLVSAKDSAREEIVKKFIKNPEMERVLAEGETKASGILKNGIQCDLRIVKEKEYPFTLQYFTGSKEHNVELRSRAKKYGLSLNEYGFTSADYAKRKTKIPLCRSEAEIYESLGLTYIQPELRENMGEITAAEKSLPHLVEYADIRGTFHCHTTYSDGLNSLEEMAAGAQALGWKFLGIADHSKIATYAGGMSIEKAREQFKAIDKLNTTFKSFKLYKGVECDILPDGSLDYPDSFLKEFDYVVVSVHSKFKMTEDEATKRIIKALKNRYTTILGHPTGRLLLEREGYPVNLKDVITAASDLGKSIEINAHPSRLDLDWRWVKYAKEKHVPICINPDAHTVDGLRHVEVGVGIARKGWLEPEDVVNTWQAKEIESLFHKHK